MSSTIFRGKEEGKLIIHRGYFAKLLAAPKSLRDQLVFELPILNGLRAGEVSTLCSERIDFERGDLMVLDSKKKVLMPVPLDPTVAKHLDEYIQETGRREGYLIQGRKHTGKGLTVIQVERLWKDHCEALDIPVMPPRYGRAYFAAKWHFVEHKSIYGLMAVLRHDAIQSTEHYLSRLCDYLTVKAEFLNGLKTPFMNMCSRFNQCPMAIEDCHCRCYTPQAEEPVFAQER